MLVNHDRIYLDNNATTGLLAESMAGITSLLSEWGNPSSIHANGRGPKVVLRDARSTIAKMLNVDPLEIIFTAGGSEGNNLAIKGYYLATHFGDSARTFGRQARNQILVGSCEHPSVLKSVRFLESLGAEVKFINVNRSGKVDLEDYASKLSEKVCLVTMMLVNNETGSVFPIGKMAKMARAVGAVFHSDAVQGLGKIPIDLRAMGVDYASFAGHKYYALKGSGFLYVKKGSPLESVIHGGGQERSRRAGTENTLAIGSLGLMAARAEELPIRMKKMASLRDAMEAWITAEISDISITGNGVDRIPNTSNIVVNGVDGEILLMNLDMAGVSISTGAACSSGSQEPSPTLRAMGLTRVEAQSSLRVSLGWQTTEDEISRFLVLLKATVERLRRPRMKEFVSHGVV